WINWEQVIVFRVLQFHDHEKDDEREAQQPPAPFAQEPDQPRKPDREQDRAYIEDLLLHKRQRPQDHVLAFALHVAKVLDGGEVMLYLPDQVRQEERESDSAGDPYPRLQEFAATLGDQQCDGHRESEDQRG